MKTTIQIIKSGHKTTILFFLTLFLLLAASCKKQDDWLNVKRQKSDVVPTTLKDFQAVLDGTNVMNSYYPVLALLGTDNSYVTDANLNGASEAERNTYIWANDIFQGQPMYAWTNSYKKIEYANIVLDGLQKVSVNSGDQSEYNNVKGSALFYRSMAFYYLAQLFCKQYVSGTASTDPGVPLRMTSDINVPSARATLQQTYDQIITDLNTAIGLLPVTPLYTTRPSKPAAYALLAKVYLDMGNYSKAGENADKSLGLYQTLLDYNNTALINPASTYRFPAFKPGNPEVIFYAEAAGYTLLWPNGDGNVDTALYNSYNANDLRKSLFYVNHGNGLVNFFGGYTGSAAYDFGGIAVDEVYLIRAECYARDGNVNAAMTDLNTLLSKRWKTGTFTAYTATSSDDALRQILNERRKELPFTEIVRWEDLRRLNLDPEFAKTITHTYKGTTYTMPPNDKKYVFLIPDIEVQTYHLQQNDR